MASTTCNALSISINNKEAVNEESYVQNNRTMIPLRFISENLGAEVEWVGKLQIIFIKMKNIKITLKENEDWSIINILGKADYRVALENRITLKNGKSFAPLRFIAETLGATVVWDNTTNTVNLTTTN